MDGKNPATVRFVQDAEHALNARSDIDENEKYALRAKIERLKADEESCDETDTLDDWLERLRDHYP